jgi:hypothetical protein
VLWAGFNTICFAHTEADVAVVLDAYRDALGVLKDALRSGTVDQVLQGEPIEPVFRRTANFNVKPRERRLA